jgi:porin
MNFVRAEKDNLRRLGAIEMASWRVAACCACAAFWHSAAWAINATSPEPSSQLPAQPSFSDVWKAFTDPGGLRSRLEQAGLKFTFTYFGDALGNPSGGVQQGLGYSGRFGTIVDADLEKFVGWSGATFHTSAQQIHGPGLSTDNLDNLLVVSGIEAQASTRLFNLWIEQKLGSEVNVRVGQFSAGQEFMVSDNADLFVNASFGWPALTAQDLPSGGPSYPEATPGVRLKITPNDQFTVMAAVFNGNPAGPGIGNPVSRDPFGVGFRVNDPPLFIAELSYDYNQDKPGGPAGDPNQEGTQGGTSARRFSGAGSSPWGLPGTVALGAWVHAGLFGDERFNTQSAPLGVAGGEPLQHRDNFALYGVVDQMLWRASDGDDRELNFFVRASAAPSDRNLIDVYLDTGLTFKAPIASRTDDTVGLGFAFARISPQASARDRDTEAFTGMPMPIRYYEAVIELTYRVQLTQNWSLQPDIQYIMHPGGYIPNPLDPSGASPIPNAFVMGLRTILKF